MTNHFYLKKAFDLAVYPGKKNGAQSLVVLLEQVSGQKVSRQNIESWIKKNKVPAHWVRYLSAAVNYKVTPHQIDPVLYPNEKDAMTQ